MKVRRIFQFQSGYQSDSTATVVQVLPWAHVVSIDKPYIRPIVRNKAS